ncbi:hypothetical protein J6590_097969 [Homalodisca vitripennis]|nr:hypothetical protein J6590_088230 [Homalodisca vitripennis]KAG8319137.1 hypothetical protein J6590_097969 [Homalodisca vitripennis]
MKSYCCEKFRCFEEPEDQVDGIACRQCEAFSYCHCRCAQYMEEKNRYDGVGKDCTTTITGQHQPAAALRRPRVVDGFLERPTTERSHREGATSPVSSPDTASSSESCFEEPEDQVDGIACRQCEAFSYCHCRCAQYMEEKNRYDGVGKDCTKAICTTATVSIVVVLIVPLAIYYTLRFYNLM